MNDVAANAQAGQMMTADGIPLKKSLKASLRREKLRAFGLVAGPARPSRRRRRTRVVR